MGRLHRGGVAPVAGLRQARIILLGKLAVNGQVHHAALSAGQADRKLHPLAAAGHHRHIALVLGIGQGLFQQRAQLNFTPDAPGFHIAQHALQIAHTAGQGVHFP